MKVKTTKAETKIVDGLKDEIQDQIDLQPLNFLADDITTATKAETKIEKKTETSYQEKYLGRPFNMYQRRTFDNNKQVQNGNTSSTKSKDDLQNKAN